MMRGGQRHKYKRGRPKLLKPCVKPQKPCGAAISQVQVTLKTMPNKPCNKPIRRKREPVDQVVKKTRLAAAFKVEMMAKARKFLIKWRGGARVTCVRNCGAVKPTPIAMAKNVIIWIGC